MLIFEIVVAMLVGGAALAAVARRIGAPYPALVALAGAALALIPGVPTLVLDPELALALFVAPVLVDAAFDASPRGLRANWRTVASLALGAVALTIILVAIVARLLDAPDDETVLGLRDRALLALLYGTGIRASECAGFQRKLENPPRLFSSFLRGASLP